MELESGVYDIFPYERLIPVVTDYI